VEDKGFKTEAGLRSPFTTDGNNWGTTLVIDESTEEWSPVEDGNFKRDVEDDDDEVRSTCATVEDSNWDMML
jgi:hypothetical protein